jgi:hypothetical protein
MALMTKNFHGVVIVIAALALAPRAHADEVADWSEAMLRAGLIAGISASNMTRPTAMVEAAMFDAVNGIEKRYTPIRVAPNGPASASRRAAAVQAAYVILSNLFGSRAVVAPAVPSAAQIAAQATFEARRTVSLLEIAESEGQARINAGTAWGEQVANEIWAWRSGDGFNAAPTPFPDNLTDGKWRRTPNLPVSTALSAAGAGYILLSNQTPWTMDNPFQFRPGPPPALNSDVYVRDYNETKRMGRFDSAARTADQTTYALFWNGGTASYLWVRVALSLIDEQGRDDNGDSHGYWGGRRRNPLLEHARLLATVTVAMADASIACWDAKYADAFWRPITAIRDEDDGNPLTVPDPDWMPLFATPAHPEYPSGHSCVSGAAAEVLRSEFGNRTRFTVDSDQMIGVTRSFRSFSSALEEVKNARIFAGIHFRTACDVGQQLGETIAEHVMSTKFQRLN